MVQAIGSNTPRRAARRPGVRVGAFVLLFALFPIGFAAWTGTTSARDLRRTQSQTARIAPAVREYVALNALRSALTDEKYFVGAAAAITDLGIDPSAVQQIVGIDILDELAQARAAVDAHLAELTNSDISTRVAAARADSASALASVNGFDEAGAAVGVLAQERFDVLRREVGTLEDGNRLTTSLQVLEATTVARQTISQQTNDYLDIRFSGRADVDEGVRRLIEQRAQYKTAVADVTRLSVDDAAVARALATTVQSVDSERFVEAIEQLIVASIAGNDRKETAMAVLVANYADVAGAYRASAVMAESHLELVEIAGASVSTGIDELNDAQADRANHTILVITLVAVGSIVFAAAMAIIFGRPLRRLADQAAALSEGESVATIRPTGPAEVRRAAEALNAATEHLRLVESQALALARGDLDNRVLNQPAPGRIGASLQEAVHTLASSMTEREEFQRRLTHEATHDGLTHLANRKASLAQLQRSLARTSRTSATVALLFIDLDGFKDVNDSYGHQAGDLVLRTIAQRLVTRVREGDHVGRLGGDEFVVIAEPVDGLDEAVALAARLLDAITAPIALEHVELRVGASIGISLAAAGDRGTGADELLRDADLAVYQAKAHGRGRIEVCTDELRAVLAAQADLDLAIRNGLATDEFVMHYQPIITTETGGVHSFEALVRWDRPELGMCWPEAFIPFAERTGLILELDRWVIRHVAQQMAAWAEVPDLAAASVAVNVSGRSLSSDSFVDDVLLPLAEHGVSPHRLVIEVTESALLEDLDLAAEKLERLRSVGIRTAIDDFGTGYTSLAHLKNLPIDILKIDRSFTNDPNAESLVKLIIDTGHLLGATIVAEGVENDDQATHLRRLGSDELQGYLFGRPCAAADLETQQAKQTPQTTRPAS